MKCWKATKLSKCVLSSVKHMALCCTADSVTFQQFNDQQGHLCYSREWFTLTSHKGDLCSKDHCFCLHYSWNNTLHILSIANEAKAGNYYICFLNHNNKLILTLYTNEIIFLRGLYLQFSEIINNKKTNSD